MQKIKKSENPNWIYAPKNAYFWDFWHFRDSEGEQLDFSVRQAMPGLICLLHCAKNQKNLMKCFWENCRKPHFWAFFTIFDALRGRAKNFTLSFFYINQFNIYRLIFMQKINKSDNQNWIYAPKMLIFAIFDIFGTLKESNQIFRCVKLCVKLKFSYASNIVQKIKKI